MQNIYDVNEFFGKYIEHRSQDVNANNLIEKPIFYSMLPDMLGKDVLDIGCGVGELCQYALSCGAGKVVGIDCSKNMLELARQNCSKDISFYNILMEQLSKIHDKFDIVTSELAFHYVEDFDKLISDIASLLKSGGKLIFSQEHPLVTAFKNPNHEKIDTKIDVMGKRYYLVSDYNVLGKRVVKWNVNGVIKYHRNFTDIINTLTRHGFVIDQLFESYADEEVIKKEPKYKYQNDRPYFLFICATLK